MGGLIVEQRSHDPLTENRVRLAFAWRPEGDPIWEDPTEDWMWEERSVGWEEGCPCCYEYMTPEHVWEEREAEEALFEDHGFLPREHYPKWKIEEIELEISLCEEEAFFPSTETSLSSPTRRMKAPPWRRGF